MRPWLFRSVWQSIVLRPWRVECFRWAPEGGGFKPVDPFQRGELHGFEVAPWSPSMSQTRDGRSGFGENRQALRHRQAAFVIQNGEDFQSIAPAPVGRCRSARGLARTEAADRRRFPPGKATDTVGQPGRPISQSNAHRRAVACPAHPSEPGSRRCRIQ